MAESVRKIRQLKLLLNAVLYNSYDGRMGKELYVPSAIYFLGKPIYERLFRLYFLVVNMYYSVVLCL